MGQPAIADQLGGLSGRDVTADRLAVHPGRRRHLPQRRAVQQHPKDLFHLDHGHRPIGQAATTTTARPTTGEPRRVVPSLADKCSPARCKTTAQRSHSRVKATPRDHQQRRRGRPGGGGGDALGADESAVQTAYQRVSSQVRCPRPRWRRRPTALASHTQGYRWAIQQSSTGARRLSSCTAAGRRIPASWRPCAPRCAAGWRRSACTEAHRRRPGAGRERGGEQLRRARLHTADRRRHRRVDLLDRTRRGLYRIVDHGHWRTPSDQPTGRGRESRSCSGSSRSF